MAYLSGPLLHAGAKNEKLPGTGVPGACVNRREKLYTLKELPQPQVLFTLGLLNLKPEPSMVSM